MKDYSVIINSPVGRLGIITKDDAVYGVEFLTSSELLTPKDVFTKKVVAQLDAYFNDSAFQFDLPLVTEGRPFQQSVWCALRKIPIGETRTYSDMSETLKSGPRAVGNACRHNPIPIIIPCHRIVAKLGLGGFSGQTSGEKMDIKTWLLRHEGSLNHAL